MFGTAAAGSLAQEGELTAPEQTEAATSCAADPTTTFIMPTTGVPFTLPPDTDDASNKDCPQVPPPPVRPPAPSLFRMVAVPIGSGLTSLKWDGARSGGLSDFRGPWDELLAQANEVSGGEPLGMVNQWVNWHVAFRDDAAGDEWASAATTLSRGFGDCEDFALAKMGLLLVLGIPSDDMYLVLLRDQRRVAHAVLAVKRDGRLFVLDNRTDKVLPADAIADYTPILSFSGQFAWTYGQRQG